MHQVTSCALRVEADLTLLDVLNLQFAANIKFTAILFKIVDSLNFHVKFIRHV